VTGRGQIRVEKQVWRATTHIEAMGMCVMGDTALCRGEGGEPWDVRDQVIVFQVAVSFP
jgi:hypothetical protein